MQTDSPYESLRTLIVDDHMLIRTTIGQILHSLGFRGVETATQGEEAWTRMNEGHDEGRPFDIVFLDWHMPVLDGFALLARTRADKRFDHTAIVMLTAEQDEQKIIRTLEQGITSYLVKPVSPETMEKNLRHVMRWLERRTSPGKKAALPEQLCQELKPVMASGMEHIFSEMFNVRILTSGEIGKDGQAYTMSAIGHLYRDDIDLTLRFLFDEDLLRPLLSQFYSPEFLEKREVYEDAACEIVNILCNQVKAYLGRQGYHLVLNLPRMERPGSAQAIDPIMNIHFSLNSDRHFLVGLEDGPPGR